MGEGEKDRLEDDPDDLFCVDHCNCCSGGQRRMPGEVMAHHEITGQRRTANTADLSLGFGLKPMRPKEPIPRKAQNQILSISNGSLFEAGSEIHLQDTKQHE